MGWGIIAGVACFLLAGTASIGSAGAAGSPAKTCGPSYGKTLIAGRRARVYSVVGSEPLSTEHIFGCLTSDSRAWKLSPLGEEKFGGARLERPILLKAPWAGGLVRSHGRDTYRLAVIARNLHTGAVTKCPAGGGIAPRRGGWVDTVVLRGNGSTAWIGSHYVYGPGIVSHGTPYETGEFGISSPLAPPHRILQEQVMACTASGGQLLDQGEGIDPESLELLGSTLTWTDAGETRSAVLE
jgi:hypothetical protein